MYYFTSLIKHLGIFRLMRKKYQCKHNNYLTYAHRLPQTNGEMFFRGDGFPVICFSPCNKRSDFIQQHFKLFPAHPKVLLESASVQRQFLDQTMTLTKLFLRAQNLMNPHRPVGPSSLSTWFNHPSIQSKDQSKYSKLCQHFSQKQIICQIRYK